MSDTRFTPGPWEWIGESLERDQSNGGPFIDPMELEVECGAYCLGGTAKLNLSEPDRALIAAAPDLYAALFTLTDAFSQACDLAYLGNDDRWAIAELRKAGEALARARGES